MIRVVVTVLVAVAIVATAMPVIEHEAGDRSDAQVRAEIDAIDAAATDLARSEEAVPGTAGARRSLTIDLPSEGIAAAAVAHVTVSPANRSYSYRIEGRDPRTVQGRTPVYPLDGEPLTLGSGGRHDLVLVLVQNEGDRRVVIAREETIEGGAIDAATG